MLQNPLRLRLHRGGSGARSSPWIRSTWRRCACGRVLLSGVCALDAPERCVLCFGVILERSGKNRTQLRTQLCSAERSPRQNAGQNAERRQNADRPQNAAQNAAVFAGAKRSLNAEDKAKRRQNAGRTQIDDRTQAERRPVSRTQAERKLASERRQNAGMPGDEARTQENAGRTQNAGENAVHIAERRTLCSGAIKAKDKFYHGQDQYLS